MSDLNVGLVGLGWAAGAHIEAFKAVEGAAVTAVCSRRKHDEAALRQRFGVPLKATTRYEDLLADPAIHAIDICSAHPDHFAQAMAAVEAGKAVLIEKPVCLRFDELKRLREAIRKARVTACVCFEVRFSAHFTLLRSVLDEGLIGDVHYGEVDYYHGCGPWYRQYVWNVKKDMGGSSLLTAGCHALDALLFLMNEPVEEVFSYSAKSKSEIFAPYEYPTTTVTVLRFKSGKAAKVTSSIDCLQPYYFHAHLLGSEGSLLDNRIYSRKLKGMTKERWSTLETALIDSGDVKDHPYQPQFQAFAESVRSGKPMPRTGFEDAYETHRVIFAADRSASERRPVNMSEFE